jgi:hypothetical protein
LNRFRHLLLVAFLAALFTALRAYGQAVLVTMALDTNSIVVGGTTTLRVYAQVLPGLQPSADRILTWYIDVLNTNGSVASASYDAMIKPASDNDVQLSSKGTADGPNRRGIYDTFLNLAGAGVTNAVQLMAIPVSGVSTGQTTFKVQAGTTVPPLAYDFLVAATNGGTAMTGGSYGSASATLNVALQSCVLNLQIAPFSGFGGPGQRLLATFAPCPGMNHTLLSRAALDDGTGWQPVTGGPHNSGSVIVTNSASQRFFRLVASP